MFHVTLVPQLLSSYPSGLRFSQACKRHDGNPFNRWCFAAVLLNAARCLYQCSYNVYCSLISGICIQAVWWNYQISKNYLQRSHGPTQDLRMSSRRIRLMSNICGSRGYVLTPPTMIIQLAKSIIDQSYTLLLGPGWDNLFRHMSPWRSWALFLYKYQHD